MGLREVRDEDSYGPDESGPQLALPIGGPRVAPPPRNNGISRVLWVSDLAARWGCSRHTARLRLLRADRASGGKLARRCGSKWYTTESLAREAETGWVEQQEYARDAIEELKKKNAKLENDLRIVKSRMREVAASFKRAAGMDRAGSVGIESEDDP